MTEPGWWQPQPLASSTVLGLDPTPWGAVHSLEQSSIWDGRATQPSLDQALFTSSTPSTEQRRPGHRIERDPITGRATTSITFTRFDGTNGHVFAMRPDGSHVRQLTDAEGVQAHSTWAPNGRFLVFSQVDAEGSSVQLLRTGSKQPRTLSGALTWSMVPHVSPNSRRIAFTSNHRGNDDLYRIRPDGTGLRRILKSPDDELSVGWGPRR